jgi:hypothetical protein
MNTQKTFKLFVGSNNDTKKLEADKIKAIASKHFDGFTFYCALGFWKGKAEKTAIIELSNENKQAVLNLAEALKQELKQEAVLIQEFNTAIQFY